MRQDISKFADGVCLGAFVNLRKASISFVMFVFQFVGPSVRPRGTTVFPLDGFLIKFDI